MAKPRKFTEQPDEPQAECAPQVSQVAPAPKPTLAEAFEQLKNAENMPEATNVDRQAKKSALAAARNVCFALQQGVTAPVIGADEYAQAHSSNVEDMRITRLRTLARTNLDVAWLLKKKDLN